LADETLGLSIRIRQLIGDLREEWQGLNQRIAAFDAGLYPERATKPHAGWRRFQGSAASTRQHWWRRWVTDKLLNMGAIWLPGSD
jgi:hypothetical protein